MKRLPKWIKPRTSLDKIRIPLYISNLEEALRIAWKALNFYEGLEGFDVGETANKAMTEIERMGNGGKA